MPPQPFLPRYGCFSGVLRGLRGCLGGLGGLDHGSRAPVGSRPFCMVESPRHVYTLGTFKYLCRCWSLQEGRPRRPRPSPSWTRRHAVDSRGRAASAAPTLAFLDPSTRRGFAGYVRRGLRLKTAARWS
ncbi:hypothetical protein ACOMHN_064596 [Nucella lapillus]